MGINRVLAAATTRPLILLYHRVDEPTASLLHREIDTISPYNFAKQLDYVRSLGYQFVSLGELIDSQKNNGRFPSERLAVVTFDDGYLDLYKQAFPLLTQRKVPFTLFLNSASIIGNHLLWVHRILGAVDRLGIVKGREVLAHELGANTGENISVLLGRLFHIQDQNRLMQIGSRLIEISCLTPVDENILAGKLYLKRDQLREMVKYGLDVECHTHEHWPLPSLSREALQSDLFMCISSIEQFVGRRPRFMSVPFGIGKEMAVQMLAELSLEGLRTSKLGLVAPDSRCYDLPCFFHGGSKKQFATDLFHLFLRELQLRR
jgi:peptidoglycan/xylan/chitin deacetylase (PgdA/CDA1 family)